MRSSRALLAAVLAGCQGPIPGPGTIDGLGRCAERFREAQVIWSGPCAGASCGPVCGGSTPSSPDLRTMDLTNGCTCTDGTNPSVAAALVDPVFRKEVLRDDKEFFGGCKAGGCNGADLTTQQDKCAFWMADPVQCFPTGFVNGFVSASGGFVVGGSGHDGDSSIKVCPFGQIASGSVAPQGAQGFVDGVFTQQAIDLRVSTQMENLMAVTPYGAIDLEAQWCRWYQGPIKLAPDSVPAGTPVPQFCRFEPRSGERISAVGDWIIEGARKGDDNTGTHVELHDVHAVASVKPDSHLSAGDCTADGAAPPGSDEKNCAVASSADCERPDTWHVLTMATFVADTAQADKLVLSVPIPASINPKVSQKLTVDMPELDVGGCLDPQMSHDVTCDDFGRCTISLTNNAGRAIESTRSCNPGDVCTCENADVSGVQDPKRICADQGIVDYTTYDRCDPSPNTHIALARDIRVSWADPDNTWECECDCEDPSVAGAMIEVAVQGCANGNLDDSESGHRRLACDTVCGGLTCGNAGGCRIGQCHPSDEPDPEAELIASFGCDVAPPAPPFSRVASAGDFQVEIDPEKSTLRVGAGSSLDDFSESGRTRVGGRAYLNDGAGPTGRRVDVANLRLWVEDFAVRAGPFGATTLHVSRGGSFVSTRIEADLLPDGGFFTPPGQVRFGVRASVEGVPGGSDFTNAGGLEVRWNPNTEKLELDALGRDEENHAIVLHVEGRVSNHPPLAVAGADRVVECTSPTTTPVTLDAGASFDPDPGDAIAHYQWFEGETGLSNVSVFDTPATLGAHAYTLHVYDRKIGSSKATQRITVVDTAAPSLLVAANPTCLWPPNHDFVLFRLGAELAYTVHDACDSSPTVEIEDVFSSEPVDAIGSGSTVRDVVHGARAACVRAERSGAGSGRTYTVVLRASDSHGNVTRVPVTVVVPHDQAATGKCLQSIGLDLPDDRCKQ